MLSEIERKKIAEAILEEAYQTRGIQKLLCRGKCMVPTLDNDVEVLVRDCLPRSLAIGDIILYKYEDRLMLHRFIYKIKRPDKTIQIVTKADISLRFDPPIRASDLIGKVVEIDRSGQKIKTQSYLWPLLSRITGALSLLEGLVYMTLNYVKQTLLRKLAVRYSYRKFILKTIKTPKLLFTGMTRTFMRIPKDG